MAEIIKYGCIKSKTLFETLEQKNALEIIDDIIFECVSIKRDVVSRDELDTGERALLNFGHTLGHALEKIHNYTELTHGEGVAIGMVMITNASQKQSLTTAGTAKRIEKLCQKYGLPTADNTSIAEIASATAGDKKSKGTSIDLIILNEIGSSVIHKIERENLLGFIS